MTRRVRFGAACAAIAVAALLGGCGAVQFKGGAPFETDKLEAVLKPGVSTQADVEAALGKPYGKGGAYLPFHEGPRTTWTYFNEAGSMDLGAGSMTDKRTYLFAYFSAATSSTATCGLAARCRRPGSARPGFHATDRRAGATATTASVKNRFAAVNLGRRRPGLGRPATTRRWNWSPES